MARFQVRMIVMERGERLPLLIGADGLPPFRPNAWLLTMRRPVHRASNTLQANCYALKFLYLWAAESGIDIDSRILSGQLLKSHEITSLAGAAARHLDEVGNNARSKPAKARKVVSLEQVRMGAPEARKTVLKHTAANRLRTVVQYLQWLGQEGSKDLDLEKASKRKAQLEVMVTKLNAKVPPTKGRNVVGLREAPPVEVMDRVLAVLEPDWPDPIPNYAPLTGKAECLDLPPELSGVVAAVIPALLQVVEERIKPAPLGRSAPCRRLPRPQPNPHRFAVEIERFGDARLRPPARLQRDDFFIAGLASGMNGSASLLSAGCGLETSFACGTINSVSVSPTGATANLAAARKSR